MDALLRGTLRLSNGCVTVEGTDGSLAVPVFPSGDASWRDGVLTWQGREYREGDSVEFGGGGGVPSKIQYLPEGCGDRQTWIVGP